MFKPLMNEGMLMANETTCLGYLLTLRGKVFDASMGAVDVTVKQANTHNALFDKALVDGLEKCKVGQGGDFYYMGGKVQTWIGTVIPGTVTIKRSGNKREINTLTLTQDTKVFTARLHKDDESIFLKRVS